VYNSENLDIENHIYKVCPAIKIEYFPDGALVLRLEGRQMLELNVTARDVLIQTDGKRTTAEVTNVLMQNYHITSLDEALQDVIELYDHFTVQGIVEVVKDNEIERRK